MPGTLHTQYTRRARARTREQTHKQLVAQPEFVVYFSTPNQLHLFCIPIVDLKCSMCTHVTLKAIVVVVVVILECVPQSFMNGTDTVEYRHLPHIPTIKISTQCSEALQCSSLALFACVRACVLVYVRSKTVTTICVFCYFSLLLPVNRYAWI